MRNVVSDQSGFFRYKYNTNETMLEIFTAEKFSYRQFLWLWKTFGILVSNKVRNYKICLLKTSSQY